MAEACPCGSGRTFKECCEPLHRGRSKADTAEQLMRARYSAFVKGDIEFLKESLSAKSRKDFDAKDLGRWARESEWHGLEIVSTHEGGAKDDKGTVEFIARYTAEDQEIEHHERGEFRRIGGEWYFIDGRMLGGKPVTRDAPKIGRNDPCHCGSGKKYKQCHFRADMAEAAAAS
jgi:SEC-C motif-containing protein